MQKRTRSFVVWYLLLTLSRKKRTIIIMAWKLHAFFHIYQACERWSHLIKHSCTSKLVWEGLLLHGEKNTYDNTHDNTTILFSNLLITWVINCLCVVMRSVCMYVCMYVCTYICMYAFMYVHCACATITRQVTTNMKDHSLNVLFNHEQ